MQQVIKSQNQLHYRVEKMDKQKEDKDVSTSSLVHVNVDMERDN